MDKKHIAHVDWFAFTVRKDYEERHSVAWLRGVLSDIFQIPVSCWNELERGWNGYRVRVELGIYGLVAYGGTSQGGTIHVELNSHGCSLVNDWQHVHDWGTSESVRITRVDLAHDDIDGEEVTMQTALVWYKSGGFTTNGRPPKSKFIDDMGSGDGCTLYVGKRENGKLVRIYEKGKQLGDDQSPWVRIEVEWKKQGRIIPWSIVCEPGVFLAGAYPCLEFLSTVQDKIKTNIKETQISYSRMRHAVRNLSGKALNIISQVHDGDAVSVLNDVIREGIPKRLEGKTEYLSEAVVLVPPSEGGKG